MWILIHFLKLLWAHEKKCLLRKRIKRVSRKIIDKGIKLTVRARKVI